VTHISRNTDNVLPRFGEDLRQEGYPLSITIFLKILLRAGVKSQSAESRLTRMSPLLFPMSRRKARTINGTSRKRGTRSRIAITRIADRR
jgi:hypothetical protein